MKRLEKEVIIYFLDCVFNNGGPQKRVVEPE